MSAPADRLQKASQCFLSTLTPRTVLRAASLMCSWGLSEFGPQARMQRLTGSWIVCRRPGSMVWICYMI